MLGLAMTSRPFGSSRISSVIVCQSLLSDRFKHFWEQRASTDGRISPFNSSTRREDAYHSHGAAVPRSCIRATSLEGIGTALIRRRDSRDTPMRRGILGEERPRKGNTSRRLRNPFNFFLNLSCFLGADAMGGHGKARHGRPSLSSISSSSSSCSIIIDHVLYPH